MTVGAISVSKSGATFMSVDALSNCVDTPEGNFERTEQLYPLHCTVRLRFTYDQVASGHKAAFILFSYFSSMKPLDASRVPKFCILEVMDDFELAEKFSLKVTEKDVKGDASRSPIRSPNHFYV